VSRIGRAPITVPSGVDIKMEGHFVTVSGPKGTLARGFHPDIAINRTDNTITVTRPTDAKHHRSLHGLTRALLANMVKGVTDGFRRELEVTGVGYRVEAKPRGVLLNVGFTHGVFVAAPAGIKIEVPKLNTIAVSGCDVELVGQVAAEIRAVKKPEPYKGKGIRYAGEVVKTKAGKTAK
jgi:large subunit ribosomal protein L6